MPNYYKYKLGKAKTKEKFNINISCGAPCRKIVSANTLKVGDNLLIKIPDGGCALAKVVEINKHLGMAESDNWFYSLNRSTKDGIWYCMMVFNKFLKEIK